MPDSQAATYTSARWSKHDAHELAVPQAPAGKEFLFLFDYGDASPKYPEIDD